MRLFTSALTICCIFFTCPSALAITFRGVVKDAVNGMHVQGVIVNFGNHWTKTDEKGVFTLESDAIATNSANSAGQYVLTFEKNETVKRVNVDASQIEGIVVPIKFRYPLKNVLHLFEESPNRLRFGPHEATTANTQCKGFVPNNSTEENPGATIPDLIGGQLERHDMAFIGEKYRVIKIVVGGQVVWKYNTRNQPENNDIWVLSNGNVLYAHQWFIEEVTPQKEMVWRVEMPGHQRYKIDPEVHSCQPIGIEKVLYLVNRVDGAYAVIYDRRTGSHTETRLEGDYKLNDPHGQARRIRRQANGHYVVTSFNTFYEYDADFKLLHSFKPGDGGMWGGVPLNNGNYILQRQRQRQSVEVDRDGRVVWSVSVDDLRDQFVRLIPDSYQQIGTTQMVERLANGNTVMFVRGCHSNRPQAIEVTPDKKVVWVLQDRAHLGDGFHAHFLDQPGYPELPGDTNH
ncbi:MAG: hypothetical protein AAGJ40_03485 [Planctomycetota bacterium]